MKLDEIDKRILKALQEQGRISNADLADSINLSQSACYRRVQRLEDDGIVCLLYTSPSPRDDVISRMPSSA